MTILYDGWTMDKEQAHRNWEDRKEYANALTWASLVGTVQQRIERAYSRMMWIAEVNAQAADHADLDELRTACRNG